jgi:hypothetical protein
MTLISLQKKPAWAAKKRFFFRVSVIPAKGGLEESNSASHPKQQRTARSCMRKGNEAKNLNEECCESQPKFRVHR